VVELRETAVRVGWGGKRVSHVHEVVSIYTVMHSTLSVIFVIIHLLGRERRKVRWDNILSIFSIVLFRK
jgi:hypothetical protein